MQEHQILSRLCQEILKVKHGNATICQHVRLIHFDVSSDFNFRRNGGVIEGETRSSKQEKQM